MGVSLKEYFGKALRRWFFYLPGVAGGIEWAISKLIPRLPELPTWAWLSIFAVGLVVAQFLAFHDARVDRDAALTRLAAEEPASFTVLDPVKWGVIANPYDPATGEIDRSPENYRGDPELSLFISGDFEAMAHGGTKGGYLHDISWSVRNAPVGFGVRLPDIPDRGIGLEALQSVPFKTTVTFGADRMRYSMAVQSLKRSHDPILVASYRRKDSNESRESQLVLRCADMLQALMNLASRYPELTA